VVCFHKDLKVLILTGVGDGASDDTLARGLRLPPMDSYSSVTVRVVPRYAFLEYGDAKLYVRRVTPSSLMSFNSARPLISLEGLTFLFLRKMVFLLIFAGMIHLPIHVCLEFPSKMHDPFHSQLDHVV
jgi:hypothetical protein